MCVLLRVVTHLCKLWSSLLLDQLNQFVLSRRFRKAGDLDHHWVANVWIHDLGLSLYAQTFHENLVDGRVLSTLDKKDMDKHLGISRKYYQVR